MKISPVWANWFVVGRTLGQSCKLSDGSGPCCYKVDAGFESDQFGAPSYTDSPLSGPAGEEGSQQQPIVHGYALAEPYYDFEGWGWKTSSGELFNYVEQQQFVFPLEASANDEIRISIESQDCNMQENTKPSKFRALWQTSTGEVWADEWHSGNYLSVDYATYTDDLSRSRGDPIYITLIPCTAIADDDWCMEFDPSRAIAVMVSFRRVPLPSDDAPELVCGQDMQDDRTGAGIDCCYVGGNIGPLASQDEIDAAVNHWTSPNGNWPSTSCLKKPSWQCFRNKDGNVHKIQYKGSLVDFMADQGRKEGQGVRIVLADTVTVNLPITTTYLEYTVDTNAPDSCNSLCGETDLPTTDDIRSSDGTCSVSAVSSFAQVNKGQVAVSGFGRIDALPFHGMKDYYFDDWTPNYDSSVDWSPGAACPICNRFCPLTPYAWGVHALTTSCWGNSQGDPLTPRTSSLRSELGDALYHIDSGLLEISSNAVNVDFAVDIADITVSNMLKRGDSAVMVQSPGHIVRSQGCEDGGLESMKRGCQGPNLPAKAFGLKYMGAWHDAVDGPSLKSEGSFTQYMYLHNADDAVKPYSNSEIRDTTAIHGGVGGLVTPCTYNLQSYTPGCYNTKTINTHAVRIMDPSAGYESNFPRGGLLATRYCAGKTSVGAAWMDASEAVVENNVVDGLIVNNLGFNSEINEVGRAVAVTVTSPMDDHGANAYEVFFCPDYYEQLTVHLKKDAFVCTNWWIESSTYRLDYVDGSGTALVETAYAWDLAVVDQLAVNLRGIASKITDPDGLGCGFHGFYYPCDRSHGFPESDSDDRVANCYVYLDGAQQYQTFTKTGMICDSWLSPRSVQCKGQDRDGDCGGWVSLPWGRHEPSSSPYLLASSGTRRSIIQV